MFQLLFSVLIFERSCTIHLSGVPVVVGVTIFILSFSSVSESAMVFNRHTTCYVNFPSKLTKEFPPNVTTHRLRMSHLALPNSKWAVVKNLVGQTGSFKKVQKDLKKRDTSHSALYVKYAQVSLHVIPACSYAAWKRA